MPRKKPRLGDAITDRERECLRQLAEGKSGKEMAASMGMAHSTARSHLYNVYQKLGVTNGTGALVVAYRAGYLNPPKGLWMPSGVPPLVRHAVRALIDAEILMEKDWDRAVQVLATMRPQ